MATASANKPWWENDVTPGLLLFVTAVASFLLMNSPLEHDFEHLLHMPVGFTLGDINPSTSLAHFINDGLMALFFLYVGLELKRETIEGPFQSPRKAASPLCAAMGGMVVPAILFMAVIGFHGPFMRGWAIPMATDIAFAIGVLSLLGSRIPKELRLFLLALAIIDDLGAILVIAVFYTTDLQGWALGGGAVTFIAMLMLNRVGVKKLLPFWLLALVLWAFVYASGLHATIAGVLAAMAIPMRRKDGRSPLIAAEHTLKPWVQLAILPVFALANAGAPLHSEGLSALSHPISLGILAGLVLGKPIGVIAGVMAARVLFKQEPPVTGRPMLGAAMLTGIGFTMSLFIGSLAFGGESDLAGPVRLGVLVASMLSGIGGYFLLSGSLPKASGKAAAATP